MNERSKIFSVTITPRGIVPYLALHNPQAKPKEMVRNVSVGRTFIMLGEQRQGQSNSEKLRYSPPFSGICLNAVDLSNRVIERI